MLMTQAQQKKDWYSVRCLFRIKGFNDSPKKYVYEERLTIWRTNSIEEAIELAEEEGKTYVGDDQSEYLGLAQGYDPITSRLTSGAEIYSLMRNSNLSAEKYLDRFFDTGDECASTI
jgi:hypothetical protein